MIDPTEIQVSGIVLAGGRSRRYGSDKLAARVGAGTLLDRSVAALAGVAVEIVLVVAPRDDRTRPAVVGPPIRLVADPVAHGGPLVGLLSGLETVDQPLAVVVGGDMPTLRPEVLGLLVRTLITEPTFSGVILRSRGMAMPLPAAIRTGAATDHARRLVGDGERRLGSLFERLPTRILEEGEWRPLDPDGDTLRDVDRPDELPTE